MPTITSQKTGPAARRQRRKARQRQKILSITFPHRQRHHRRALPKRQLQEQSADVDDCYEDCQEVGYHLDPDVQVGAFAAQGNRFSKLDLEYSSPATPDPIPTPYQDHTIRPPNPFLAELEWYVAKKSYPELEDIDRTNSPGSEKEKEPSPLASKFWRRSREIDDLEANRSSISQTPSPTARAIIPPSGKRSSIPASPPTEIAISMSSASLQDYDSASTFRPSKKRKLNDAPLSPFLTGYRIPSPLLYHRPSRDALPNIDDEQNTCICLGPSLECAGEDHQNIFRSNSNGSSCSQSLANLTLESTKPLMQAEYDYATTTVPKSSIATPYLPSERAVLWSDPASYTNTRPYLLSRKSPASSRSVISISTPSTKQVIQPITKANNFTPHVCAAEDLRLTDIALAANSTSLSRVLASEQSVPPSQSRSLLCGHDLIYPRLSTSILRHDKSLARNIRRTIDFWSCQEDEKQQQDSSPPTLKSSTVDRGQERRSSSQDLWDAYEKAVLGPKTQDPVSSKHFCVLSEPLSRMVDQIKMPTFAVPGSLTVDLKPSKDIKIPACSLSTCAALVPANLYVTNYLGLTRRWDSDIWNLEQRPLPTSNAIVKQIQENQPQEKNQQVVDWLTEDLDLGKTFPDEQDADGACLSWLRMDWDGHMFYPKTVASEVTLQLSSPFEDVELDDKGHITKGEAGAETQVDDKVDDEIWCDWDEDASGWSETSEEDFFDFKL